MAQEVRDRGIVLGTVDYGESDRIVTLLTRDHGKVGAFARGARASRRRFAGALLPFTVLEVRLVSRRGELFGLSSCTIEESFPGLRESLEAISLAGYAAELCRELCKEREPHPELFERLRAYLAALAAGEAGEAQRMAFELGAVADAGLMPRLDACARCGAGVSQARACFDPVAGGLLCARCEPFASGQRVRLGPAALELLREAQSAVFELGDRAPGVRLAVREPVPGEPRVEARREARQAVRRYLRHVLGKELRSLEVLRQVGLEG
ncbi:MAG: DNA repair protein RecO [Pseudomonadota bacterium]|nr:MAG: DNA repair protein RecO [Pseudomonadota bacterium]